MPRIVERTMPGMSAYPAVVTSPATWTSPVVTRVSTATRLVGSCASRASRMASLIWSQILSGWPSVTDSEVNRRWLTALLSQRLLTDPRCRRGGQDDSDYCTEARDLLGPASPAGGKRASTASQTASATASLLSSGTPRV